MFKGLICKWWNEMIMDLVIYIELFKWMVNLVEICVIKLEEKW